MRAPSHCAAGLEARKDMAVVALGKFDKKAIRKWYADDELDVIRA